MEVKKILIVDDDSKNTFALSAVLAARGYKCLTAPGVQQALGLLQGNKDIGIVLSDIMMPGIDGFDLIRVIRANEQTKNIPVVAITAQAMPGDRERVLGMGADDYVSKPVNIDLLITILRKYEIAGSEAVR